MNKEIKEFERIKKEEEKLYKKLQIKYRRKKNEFQKLLEYIKLLPTSPEDKNGIDGYVFYKENKCSSDILFVNIPNHRTLSFSVGYFSYFVSDLPMICEEILPRYKKVISNLLTEKIKEKELSVKELKEFLNKK